MQLFTQNQVNRLFGKKTTTTAKSNNQSRATSNARWIKTSATVYVNLSNQTLRTAAEQAITAWNQTGAFTFQQTNDKDKADIVITAMNEEKDGAAGLTTTQMNETTGYLTHATVQLNASYLLNPSYGYSQERIVNTAEHELGHAIGLQHSSAVSVMQPAGSFYSIQPQDVQNVKKLYQNQFPAGNQQSGQTGSTQNYQ